MAKGGERFAAGVLVVIGWFVVVGLLMTVPLYFLWNWLMPGLFHLPVITLWQSLGLNWLCGILFRSSSSGSSSNHVEGDDDHG